MKRKAAASGYLDLPDLGLSARLLQSKCPMENTAHILVSGKRPLLSACHRLGELSADRSNSMVILDTIAMAPA